MTLSLSAATVVASPSPAMSMAAVGHPRGSRHRAANTPARLSIQSSSSPPRLPRLPRLAPREWPRELGAEPPAGAFAPRPLSDVDEAAPGGQKTSTPPVGHEEPGAGATSSSSTPPFLGRSPSFTASFRRVAIALAARATACDDDKAGRGLGVRLFAFAPAGEFIPRFSCVWVDAVISPSRSDATTGRARAQRRWRPRTPHPAGPWWSRRRSDSAPRASARGGRRSSVSAMTRAPRRIEVASVGHRLARARRAIFPRPATGATPPPPRPRRTRPATTSSPPRLHPATPRPPTPTTTTPPSVESASPAPRLVACSRRATVAARCATSTSRAWTPGATRARARTTRRTTRATSAASATAPSAARGRRSSRIPRRPIVSRGPQPPPPRSSPEPSPAPSPRARSSPSSPGSHARFAAHRYATDSRRLPRFAASSRASTRSPRPDRRTIGETSSTSPSTPPPPPRRFVSPPNPPNARREPSPARSPPAPASPPPRCTSSSRFTASSGGPTRARRGGIPRAPRDGSREAPPSPTSSTVSSPAWSSSAR